MWQSFLSKPTSTTKMVQIIFYNTLIPRSKYHQFIGTIQHLHPWQYTSFWSKVDSSKNMYTLLSNKAFDLHIPVHHLINYVSAWYSCVQCIRTVANACPIRICCKELYATKNLTRTIYLPEGNIEQCISKKTIFDKIPLHQTKRILSTKRTVVHFNWQLFLSSPTTKIAIFVFKKMNSMVNVTSIFSHTTIAASMIMQRFLKRHWLKDKRVHFVNEVFKVYVADSKITFNTAYNKLSVISQ
jgi:hypothetical protein